MAYAIVPDFAGVNQTRHDAGNEKLGIDMAARTGDFPGRARQPAPVRRFRPRAGCDTVRA
jgi:hypothetical protein